MKIAMIGVSHWHSPMYSAALRKMELPIAAVSDPDPAVRAKWESETGAKTFADYRELMERARPDFAFCFGRHIEMPAIARCMIASGAAFCMEKPAGICAPEVAELAALAEKKKCFTAVPFVLRKSQFVRKVQGALSAAPAGSITHLAFRYLAGGPERYLEAGCDWLLDPAQSGGGCLINLGIHYADLFLFLAGERAIVAGARMSNVLHNKAVEDYGAILLASAGGVTGVIESGYSCPPGVADMTFVVVSRAGYFTLQGNTFTEWDRAGRKKVTTLADGNQYETFVRATLDAYQRGEPPVATLRDAARALEIINAAYRFNDKSFSGKETS